MTRAKILAVDHDHGTYELLKPGLSRHGYEIHTSTTVAKALALVGVHAYQAALVSLPLLDDQVLWEGLRAEIPDLPVIATLAPEHGSALSPQALQRATHTMGKPLALELVCLMLDRTLELMALRTQVQQHYHARRWKPGLQAASPDVEGGERPVPLSESMAHKLCHIVPNLEVLGGGSLHHAVLSYVEKLLLTIVLSECRGNQLKSADILGINRNTLRKKMQAFGLSRPRGNA